MTGRFKAIDRPYAGDRLSATRTTAVDFRLEWSGRVPSNGIKCCAVGSIPFQADLMLLRYQRASTVCWGQGPMLPISEMPLETVRWRQAVQPSKPFFIGIAESLWDFALRLTEGGSVAAPRARSDEFASDSAAQKWPSRFERRIALDQLEKDTGEINMAGRYLAKAMYLSCDLSREMRLTLIYLADNADTDGMCNALDVEVLAKLVRAEVPHLHGIFRSLAEVGLITITGTSIQLTLD
jgi:hypothetical protein